MAKEWDFSPDVLASAAEIGIGTRVAVHWSEAECQDQEGTVVGVDIRRYGLIDYSVHIDGDTSPTDGFTHDRIGKDGGTISVLSRATTAETQLASLTKRVGELEGASHRQFRLEWDAAARPPVHPGPARGKQTFASFDAAVHFMARLPSDSTFVSLVEIASRETDLTADAARRLTGGEG